MSYGHFSMSKCSSDIFYDNSCVSLHGPDMLYGYFGVS